MESRLESRDLTLAPCNCRDSVSKAPWALSPLRCHFHQFTVSFSGFRRKSVANAPGNGPNADTSRVVLSNGPKLKLPFSAYFTSELLYQVVGRQRPTDRDKAVAYFLGNRGTIEESSEILCTHTVMGDVLATNPTVTVTNEKIGNATGPPLPVTVASLQLGTVSGFADSQGQQTLSSG
ncbi:hypothetical protein B0H16DRAFT_1451388 [Mycena metata]|uniref:Uncharacterized protein n=1 Tax=Mycena metata TaxID=1033252 RepID=A0AAD7NRN5_9AGAR|nr:hypothetical protein B0H16DRAFT_1451388 [Mycena metata]